MKLFAKSLLLFTIAYSLHPAFASPIPRSRKINYQSSQLHLLERERVPERGRRSWQPTALVAILGEQRGHHWQQIDRVSYSFDGKRIATLSGERVYLWNASNLRFQYVLPIKASFIQFLSEHDNLLTCGEDGIARQWDVSGVKPRSLVVRRGIVRDFLHVAASPDGKKLAVSTHEGFNYYNLSAAPAKGSYIKIGKKKSLLEIAFSPDSRTLAISKAKVDPFLTGFIRGPWISEVGIALWDVSGAVPKLCCPLNLTESYNPKGRFAFSPDSKTIVWGAHIWDLSKGKPKFRTAMNAPDEWIDDCLFLPDTQCAITVRNDSSNYRLQLRDMRPSMPRILQTVWLSSYYCGMALAPDTKTLAVSELNCLRLWHIQEGKLRKPLSSNGHSQAVKGLSFGAWGNLLATIGWDKSLRLWDLDGPRPHSRLVYKRKWGSWDTVALSPDGTKLAAGFRSGGFTLWEVSSSGLRVLAEYRAKAAALAFTPDSKSLLVTGDLDGVKIIDVSKPSKIAAILLAGSGRPLLGTEILAVSPDGKMLAIAENFTIELWQRTETGWEKRTHFHAFCKIKSMSFGPHGDTLLVGGGIYKKPEVRLFNIRGEKPEELANFIGHKEAVLSVTASSNGKLFASSDEGGRVIVWSAAGKRLHDWTFPGPVHSIAFAPDGVHLALGNGDGTVYILRLTPFGQGKRPPSTR